MSFLQENTKKSSMRLNLLLASGSCTVILLCVALYIVVKAFKDIEITQWTEMGIFCTGVATVITGAAWMKQRQKKDEIKNGNAG